MKFKNNLEKSNLLFISFLILIVHLVMSTLWFSWEKDKLKERARKQAILSNDLLSFLKQREQSYLEELLNKRDIKKSLTNLSMVSQYETAQLISIDNRESYPVFGDGFSETEKDHLKEDIFKKWITLGSPFYENIFVKFQERSYIGRYVTDTINKTNYLLIIKMKKHHFPQILNIDPENFNRETYVFDESNLLVVSREAPTEKVLKLAEKKGYSEEIIGGDLYITVTNNINHWKTLLVFRNIFRGAALNVFFLTFFITIPLAALMFGIFKMFSYEFYRSFKNILDYLEDSMDGDPNKNIEDLLQTKKSYEESLPKLKEQFLLNILKREEQLPKQIIEKYHFNFKSNSYFIVGILPKSLLLKDDFLAFLKNWNGKIDTAPAENLIIIFSEDAKEKLNTVPLALGSFIDEEIGAFSDIKTGFSHLNTAYQESLFCWNSSLRLRSHIITPALLREINSYSPDISKAKKNLFSALKDGTDWRPHFESLAGELFASGQSVMTLKTTFIHLLSELLNLDEQESSKELSEEVFFKFENLNTHSKVETFFIEVIKKLEEKLNLKRLENDSIVSSKIEEYIKSKYSDMNFTISSLASDLGYSISYLERKFKSTHKVSIKEYLINVRIQSAKDHLKNDSSLRIKELAWMVGYENSRSFINIFKKYVGITPGEYKKSL